ncbi:MAG: hypothetical protein IJW47_02235 [Clostridia bacterium]|nr:hypothetical protein [Clostridia bacterium]
MVQFFLPSSIFSVIALVLLFFMNVFKGKAKSVFRILFIISAVLFFVFGVLTVISAIIILYR